MLRAACHFLTSAVPRVVQKWCVLYILTYACTLGHSRALFLISQLPKLVRAWCVIYILTCTWASRHSCVPFFDIPTSKSGPHLVFILSASRHGVQFFISHLTRCLRARRFSEPIFRSSRPTKHWKNAMFGDVPNI